MASICHGNGLYAPREVTCCLNRHWSPSGPQSMCTMTTNMRKMVDCDLAWPAVEYCAEVFRVCRKHYYGEQGHNRKALLKYQLRNTLLTDNVTECGVQWLRLRSWQSIIWSIQCPPLTKKVLVQPHTATVQQSTTTVLLSHASECEQYALLEEMYSDHS